MRTQSDLEATDVPGFDAARRGGPRVACLAVVSLLLMPSRVNAYAREPHRANLVNPGPTRTSISLSSRDNIGRLHRTHIARLVLELAAIACSSWSRRSKSSVCRP